MGNSCQSPQATPEVTAVVDRIMDSRFNISGVPDSLERAIYLRSITAMLSLLEQGIETINIKVLGYQIKFVVTKDNEHPDSTSPEVRP